MFEKYLVEFIGTMLLVYVFLATGNAVAVGATFAFVLLLTSSISGGYINPAITIVMAAYGKLPIKDVLPYCLSQVFGALVAFQIFKHFKL